MCTDDSDMRWVDNKLHQKFKSVFAALNHEMLEEYDEFIPAIGAPPPVATSSGGNNQSTVDGHAQQSSTAELEQALPTVTVTNWGSQSTRQALSTVTITRGSRSAKQALPTVTVIRGLQPLEQAVSTVTMTLWGSQPPIDPGFATITLRLEDTSPTNVVGYTTITL